MFFHAHLNSIKLTKETGFLETSFKSAELWKIDFSVLQELTALDFTKSRIYSCCFDGCWVHDCNFTRASISSASFRFASLYKVDFTGATGWDQSTFDHAFGIKAGEGHTRLPSGASYPKHWIDLSQLGEEFDAHATFEHEYEEWKKSLIKPL